MTTLLAILAGALVAIVVIGYLLTVINFVERVVSLWHRYILKQPKVEPATKEDVTEIKGAVEELRGQLSSYVDGLHEAKAEVRDHFEEGRRLQGAEQHDAAIAQLEKAFAAADNDSQRCALHIVVANSFLLTGRLAEAEGRYREALDAAKRGKDREGEAAALGSLGVVYRERGELNSAEEHLKKALAIDEQIGHRLGQANELGNLGNVYVLRGELKNAEEQYRKALEIHQGLGDRLGQANQLGNLGNVYVLRGELDKAEEHHQQALTIDKEIGYRFGQAEDLANLGVLQTRRANAREALRYLRDARGMLAQVGASHKVQSADHLIRSLEAAVASKPKPKPRPKKPPSKPC